MLGDVGAEGDLLGELLPRHQLGGLLEVLGLGSTWASSPGTPALGQIS